MFSKCEMSVITCILIWIFNFFYWSTCLFSFLAPCVVYWYCLYYSLNYGVVISPALFLAIQYHLQFHMTCWVFLYFCEELWCIPLIVPDICTICYLVNFIHFGTGIILWFHQSIWLLWEGNIVLTENIRLLKCQGLGASFNSKSSKW